jgi:hypothetical protein
MGAEDLVFSSAVEAGIVARTPTAGFSPRHPDFWHFAFIDY